MKKIKYYYHPNDDESDYKLGDHYRGKVLRVIQTKSKHPRAIEVVFPDGKVTTVHKRSFEVSETAIEYYPPGVAITLKKVGYMADRRVTKWVIIRPLKYALYSPEGFSLMMENKRQKAGETTKYQTPKPQPQQSSPSLLARIKGVLSSIIPH